VQGFGANVGVGVGVGSEVGVGVGVGVGVAVLVGVGSGVISGLGFGTSTPPPEVCDDARSTLFPHEMRVVALRAVKIDRLRREIFLLIG